MVGSIIASDQERQSGRLTENDLELAVYHLHYDGLVVVQNVVEHHPFDQLNNKMNGDTLTLAGRGARSPYNCNRGNLQQDAPPVRQYFEPSIFLSMSPYFRVQTDLP